MVILPRCAECGGAGALEGDWEQEKSGQTVSSFGKCKVSSCVVEASNTVLQALCLASSTCVYFAWKDIQWRTEGYWQNREYKEREVMDSNYFCRIFPVDSFAIRKPAKPWEYGPRVCLSNFNPGKIFLEISDLAIGGHHFLDHLPLVRRRPPTEDNI